MLIEKVRKLKPIQRMLYWIQERESIRLKKEAGEPKPWTTDEILQKYKFCNICRKDDRVSRWLVDNWYKPHGNHPNILTAITLARQLNNTDSLEAVGFPLKWEAKRVRSVLEKRVKDGLKNFSAAYMITGTLGGTKIEQIVHKVVTPLHNNPPEIVWESMEETHRLLMPYAGFSTFIAGQVVADLRLARPGVNCWIDRMCWAPKGPGSKRGMNRLQGRDKDDALKQEQFLSELIEFIQECEDNLPASVTDRLEAMDYQNCLCEFDKYERTLWEGRRPKQLYNGIGN